MEAIPSLCASTASCGIAAIGYALAQPPPPKHLSLDQTVHDQTTPSNPPTLRQTLSSTSTPPSKARASYRSSSAASPLLPTPEGGFVADGGANEGEISIDREEEGSSPYAPSKADRFEDDTAKRTSWAHRLSTIAPSLDGSLGSPSLNRPSSPSIFSNGSNVPLWSHPPPVTPRNKLVKRSMSQRVLHSGSPSTSPFSSRNPTFRRPATSYQRSENLRLQNAQQNLGLSDPTSQTSHEPLHDSTVADLILGPEPSSSIAQWRPFFRYRRKRIGLEPTSRRASVSKILGGSDFVCCVESRPGVEPVLVIGTSVQKPKMDLSRSFDSPFRAVDESGSDVEAGVPKASMPRPERKSRNSFSISDFKKSSSPPSWKASRGGSLKRKKGREGSAPGRRIVSAPQQSNLDGTTETSIILQAKSGKLLTEYKGSTSPIPPLEQFSAFEVDLPGTSSSNHTGSMGEDLNPHMYQESPLAHVSSSHGVSAAMRARSSSHRASRVPSDHSTTFGSDNEHSRVFSTDGEDADFRSETAYDSLRTDASGSSHSGGRSHRVETVFGDQTPPESVKQNIAVSQEKLSRISLMNYKRSEDCIAEEESVQTPTRRQKLLEIGTSATLIPSNHSSAVNDRSLSSHQPDTIQRGDFSQVLNNENMPNIEEDDWDEELGIDTIQSEDPVQRQPTKSSNPIETAYVEPVILPERPKSNIFEWSERQLPDKSSQAGSSLRPRTAHPQHNVERGGRPPGRRPTGGLHLRSQSVPLPPENSKHRFNNSAKLDSWKLGSKGESEKWDDDFELDEPSTVRDTTAERNSSEGVVVPREILESQASVHGQFGQVKELSLLVEELRRLHHQAGVYGILNSQSSGLWKEAEGIIDLATLDEDEPPQSPNSTNFEFDAFDEDPVNLGPRQRRSSNGRSRRGSQGQKDSSPATQSNIFPSPTSSRQGTPKARPRQDSVARAKNVLENINQHRSPFEPPLEPLEERTPSGSPSKKMPFDTTSLRDLVTRAGVVTRALKEVIRRAEDPDYVPNTPERRSASPPDPPFVSQIFHQNSPHSSPSPSNDRKSPSARERAGGALGVSSLPSHDHEVHGHNHGHAHMMTVV